MKCIGVNLTRYVQDLYMENYKGRVKETKEDVAKCADIHIMNWKTHYC